MNEGWMEKAVFAIAAWLVSWGTWITLRSFGGLSRADHERLCEKRQKEVDERLKALGEKQDEILSLLIDVIRKGK